MKPYIIIDFDSTFTKVEGLDLLAEISLKGRSDRAEKVKRIREITNLGMEGKIKFKKSLEERLKLLEAKREDIDVLVKRLEKKISSSFKRNEAFFQEYGSQILIISSGFKEFIQPIVEPFGIPTRNIYANEFTYDSQGRITGFDKRRILASNNGKVKQIKALELKGPVYVIGDGYTDYEIKESGLADKFYAFTENVKRTSVTDVADHITPSLDEFLYKHKLPMAISYPKSRIKVLVLENIHNEAIKIFKEEGYQVERVNRALEETELIKKIQDVSILCIRSKTQVSKRVLEAGNKLHAIGAFCIGTNQIDLHAAMDQGVAVYNAPYSNTRSVVELAIAQIIMLMRRIPERMRAMDQGEWRKSAEKSNEVRGKVLGIIGYGNIGSQLSVVAESLGMEVVYYDIIDKMPLGNARELPDLESLLKISDAVTVHVDGRQSNKNLIGRSQIAKMKKDSILLNLSRGHVIDFAAVKTSLENKKLKGFSADVFPHEPANNKEEFKLPIRGYENTILTPHIGGSTLEAQSNIARFVPDKIMKYINAGNTYGSVNFPNLRLPDQGDAHRLIHIHQNISGVLAQVNDTIADFNVNIVGQYLGTNERIGYVITDINKIYHKDLMKQLRKIEGTIKVRVLY